MKWGEDSPILKVPSAGIINRYSSGGVLAAGASLNFMNEVTNYALSGALNANELKTMLTVTGSGVLNFAAVSTLDTTSRTVRLKIVIDGITVFDSTSSASVAMGKGIVGAGIATNMTSGAPVLQHLPFYASLLIQIASSITETDKVGFGYLYYLT